MTVDFESFAEDVSTPAIFGEATVHQPMRGVTEPDPSQVNWTASDLYDDQEQEHWECFPVTGCRITVREGRTLSYSVQIAPLLNGADADTPTRLVHTESEKEAIEWVERLMAIIDTQPSGWALAPTQGSEYLRWLSLDEEPIAVELWQEDRNMGEPRIWRLIERSDPEGRRGTRSELQTDLQTGELQSAIVSALEDHPKRGAGDEQPDSEPTPGDIIGAYCDGIRERGMVRLGDDDWQMVDRKVHSYFGNGMTADEVEWYGIDDPEEGSSLRLIWRHRDTPTFLIATSVSVVGGGREPKAHVTINGTAITIGIHHHHESVAEILDWIEEQAETLDVDDLYDGDPPAFGVREVKAFGESADQTTTATQQGAH